MLVLEHRPIVICQCIPPCFMPFRDEMGEWASVGCLMPTGHEGEHGPDGPGEVIYRDPPARTGFRVVLRKADGLDVWSGHCQRCHRNYSMRAEPEPALIGEA